MRTPNPESISLRDAIMALLELASPTIREEAWAWVCFEMSLLSRIDEPKSSRLGDDVVKFLKQNPERLAKHLELIQQSLDNTRQNVARLEAHLNRFVDAD